jgi:glycerophosphoryl diester phosphodiesterase
VAFLDGPTPIAFAHRGFTADGVGNSLPAFQRAVDLGYRYLETDIRVTADGVALAFHDAKLDRTTDGVGRVDRLRWAEVRSARIGGVEPIPVLSELLTTWPDVRFNLDLKAVSSIGPAVDAIRRAGALDRVCVAAFSSRRIAAARRALGPNLCTAVGPRGVFSLQVARRLRGQGIRCVQAPARVRDRSFITGRFIDASHAAGLQVHAFTINDEAEMSRLLDLGIDGVMTDRADVLRDLLVRRGQWTT